jgi:hypothetical protein
MRLRFFYILFSLLLSGFTGVSQTVYALLSDSASQTGSDVEMLSADVVFDNYPDNYIVDSIIVVATIGEDCSDYYSLSVLLNDTEKIANSCDGIYRLSGVSGIQLNNLKISVVSNDEDESDDWVTVTNKTTVFFHYPKPSHDIALLQWISPLSACVLSDTEHITILLSNHGSDTEQVVPFRYTVDGGAHWLTDTLQDTLLPDDSLLYSFSSAVDFSHYGRYACKVIVDFLADTIYFNDTVQIEVQNKTIFGDDLSFSESFDQYSDFPSGWETQSNRIYAWHMYHGPTPTVNTGPSSDHTSGTGGFVYIEASDGFEGDTAWLMSPCLSFDTVSSPLRLSFWYHMYGEGISQLFTEVLIGGEWVCIDTITGQQQEQSVSAWKNRRLSISKDIKKIRFWSYVKSNSTRFYGDIAIDDVSFEKILPHDLSVVAMDYNTDICEGTDTVSMVIVNVGTNTESNFQVAYSTDGGSSFTTETVSASISPNDSLVYRFTTIPTFSQGKYSVTGVVTLSGDGTTQNDTLSGDSIFVSPIITSFPYYQDFETTQYWYAKGRNVSWQLGTPTATVINVAASGSSAWVTNLSGDYPKNEYSYLVSPCYDFSTIKKPMIEFDCFIETETYWDGVHLEYSIDGKTWKTVGKYADWYHWYNDDDVDAIVDDADGWSGKTNHWIHVKHQLDFLAEQPSVKFRFVFASDNDTQKEGVAIDNVALHDYTNLTVVYPKDSALYCGLNTPFEVHLKNTGNVLIPKDDTVFIAYAVDGDTTKEVLVLDNNILPEDSVIFSFSSVYSFPATDTLYQYSTWITYGNDDVDYDDTATVTLAHYSLTLDLGDTIQTWQPDTVVLMVDTDYVSYWWNVDSDDYRITIPDYGHYSVQVTDTNGCHLLGSVEVIYPLSVNDLDKKELLISIYPNPADDAIIISSGNKIQTIELWSIAGKLYKKEKANGLYKYRLLLNDLPQGIYILHIIGNNAQTSAKLIKR